MDTCVYTHTHTYRMYKLIFRKDTPGAYKKTRKWLLFYVF